jgi:hypothetical protein
MSRRYQEPLRLAQPRHSATTAAYQTPFVPPGRLRTETPLEPYVRWLSRYFFVPGYDADDLAQEARIAAWCAPDGLERLAARRRVIELLRRSKRGGRPTFVALSEHESTENVHDIAEARETLRRIARAPLSELEREAVRRVAIGEPCPKPVLHNALGRARRKLAA